jgi:6-phosphogluconolactonase
MMNRLPPEIQVLEDDGSLEKFAAETITTLAREAVAERGEFHLVLSGGGTPSPVYVLMSEPGYLERFPWPQTHVYWGDERNVPAGDPGSNYGQAQKLLLGKVPLQQRHVHRIKGELSPLEAAADYRQQLQELGSAEKPWPIFDVVLLGMGGDGHTASLFPGIFNPLEETSAVMAVQADYKDRPANRVTLTPLILNDARTIIVLVKGGQKAEAVASILNGPEDKKRWPIHRIRPASGRIFWLMDEAAAAGL